MHVHVYRSAHEAVLSASKKALQLTEECYVADMRQTHAWGDKMRDRVGILMLELSGEKLKAHQRWVLENPFPFDATRRRNAMRRSKGPLLHSLASLLLLFCFSLASLLLLSCFSLASLLLPCDVSLVSLLRSAFNSASASVSKFGRTFALAMPPSRLGRM